MPPENSIYGLAEKLLARCAASGIMISTAESCTGGMIAAALTDVPGSSSGFERGFVTYSNGAKTELLGVSPKLLLRAGAVSAETAEAMARGALAHVPDQVKLAIAVTGIAGPSGGREEKPVGLVFIAIGRRDTSRGMTEVKIGRYAFTGDRAAIRGSTVKTALQLALEMVEATAKS